MNIKFFPNPKLTIDYFTLWKIVRFKLSKWRVQSVYGNRVNACYIYKGITIKHLTADHHFSESIAMWTHNHSSTRMHKHFTALAYLDLHVQCALKIPHPSHQCSEPCLQDQELFGYGCLNHTFASITAQRESSPSLHPSHSATQCYLWIAYN